MLRIVVLAIVLFFVLVPCFADTDVSPPKIGNFSLPNSQQPGPLIGVGENILAKHQTQVFLFADDYLGINEHLIDVVPVVNYGITDNLVLGLNVPYAASYQQGSQQSSGFEDAFFQMEYAFYNYSTLTFQDQATVVVNASAPTGSIYKNPPTGYGSPTFSLGATYNRTCVDWFVFGSPSVSLTTARNGTKFGNSYLYQFGFGRNISYKNGWLQAWMVEIDGTYHQKDRILGAMNPNSGGNSVYVTPSYWASTKSFVFQLGVGYTVAQLLYGNQPRNTWLLATNLGWTF